MGVFNDATERALLAAGWHAGRIVDVGAVLTDLRGSGIAVTRAAEVFLREFHGLTVRALNPRTPESPSFVFFDPLKVNFDRSEQDALAKLVGEQACPIGYTSGLMELFMTGSGRIAYVDADWLCFGLVGDSPVVAIEALCEGRRLNGVLLNDRFEPSGSFE